MDYGYRSYRAALYLVGAFEDLPDSIIRYSSKASSVYLIGNSELDSDLEKILKELK